MVEGECRSPTVWRVFDSLVADPNAMSSLAKSPNFNHSMQMGCTIAAGKPNISCNISVELKGTAELRRVNSQK
jgi:hypothetical protein